MSKTPDECIYCGEEVKDYPRHLRYECEAKE